MRLNFHNLVTDESGVSPPPLPLLSLRAAGTGRGGGGPVVRAVDAGGAGEGVQEGVSNGRND